MDNNLDVWAIQYEPGELKTAMASWKNDGTTILFSNALCNFYFGEVKIVSRQFDTFLYSEENDRLIMLMRGGKATAVDIREELDKQGIVYQEVILAPVISDYKAGYEIPEIWVAREPYVLEDALKDSIKRNSIGPVDYYPKLEGKLELDYLTNNNERFNLNGRSFKGLIQMEDKMVLIVNQIDERNIKEKQVYELLNQYGFDYDTIENGMPLVIANEIKPSRVR